MPQPNKCRISAWPGIGPFALAAWFLLSPLLSAQEAPAPATPAVTEAKAAAPGDAFEVPPEVEVVDRMIVKSVASLISKYHYSGRALDDEVSQLLFDEFFDRLDPNREYFLASDIEHFSPYRRILDDMLNQGIYDFAREVTRTYLQRLRERMAFVQQTLAKPVDLTAKETLNYDRHKAPWLRDLAEQDALWGKLVKNRLLVFRLMEDQMALDPDADPDPANPELKKKDAAFRSQFTPEQRVARYYEQYLKTMEEMDHQDLVENFLTVLTQVYDPHSGYMNNRTLDDFDISMKLSLTGIGATLSSEDGYTKIVSLVPGGPAAADGRLQPGDRIIAVAQGSGEPADVINVPLNKVVSLIRGKKGTPVNLTVIRDLNSAPTSIQIVRDEVKLTESEAKGTVKLLETEPGHTISVGVVDLPSFYADFDALRAGDPNAKSTTTDVKRLIDKMRKEHDIQGLVLDLRSNGGGSLDEAISLAGLFVPSGPMVQVRDTARIEVRDDEDDGFAYDLPLVVLTDRASASASEIFAAAMQDYQRAIIVGAGTTHGKGTVQTILKLSRYPALRNAKPGAMKYTLAKFYRVNGGSTQIKGVTPDIVYPSLYDGLEIGEASLTHALPWDEIPAQPITLGKQAVGPLREQLNTLSHERVAKDPEFQAFLEDVRHYTDRQKDKTLSLNLDERRARRAEDETWAKRREETFRRGGNRLEDDKPDAPPGKVAEIKDALLKEGVSVLGDLIESLKRQPLAVQKKPTTEPVQ
jgi:carboxyl-terminal processing protease